MAGVFRRKWPSYYDPRRKYLNVSEAAVSTSFNAVSKIHPSRNFSLRDSTFRPLKTEYYRIRHVLPPAVFVPGITQLISRVHPRDNLRLRDRTFRPPWLNIYQPRHVISSRVFEPGITQVVSKVHPSRNLSLRDRTFRPPWLNIYQPRHVIPPKVFVPGIFNAKYPGLRNRWFREVDRRYYRVKRTLPPGAATVVPNVSVPGVGRNHPSRNPALRQRLGSKQYYRLRHVFSGMLSVAAILPLVSRVHPSRNLSLRDKTFRPPWLNVYQPRHVIPPKVFVPGAILTKSPRLKIPWAKKATSHRYYQIRRVIPSTVFDVSVVGVSKIHPSRNALLRQRQSPNIQHYQPRRVIYPSLFVAGIVVLISKVHPSRNTKLRDKTFRPPYLEYYQPKRVVLIPEEAVSALGEVLFKGMWRGMYKKMR